MGVSVEHEEGLRGLGRAYGFIEAVAAHVAFTEAADAMGIDGQQPALKMARGATHLAQSDLQTLAVSDSSSPEELVDGHVAGEERKAVGQLEDLLVQAAAQPQAGECTAPPRGSVAEPDAVRRVPGVSRSSRTPGPRLPAVAIRGQAATSRPGFP